MGAVIECWPPAPTNPRSPPTTNPSLVDLKPTFNTFVLNVNSNDGVIMEKVYGACIMFYERFNRAWLSSHQLDLLRSNGARIPLDSDGNEDTSELNLHSNKCLLILSRNPLFDTYRSFLDFILRKYTSKLASSLTTSEFLPIERLKNILKNFWKFF